MYKNKIKNPNLLLAWIRIDLAFWKKSLDMKGVWMCRIMEDMRNESLQEGLQKGVQEEKKMAVIRMLSDGMLTLEKIAEYSELPLDEAMLTT